MDTFLFIPRIVTTDEVMQRSLIDFCNFLDRSSMEVELGWIIVTAFFWEDLPKLNRHFFSCGVYFVCLFVLYTFV